MENKGFRTLKQRSEFADLKKTGKRFSPTPWLLINFRKNPQGYLSCGWTVSGKVGSAVVRNKLKRWCRDYFSNLSQRGYQLELDLNVIFKPVNSIFYKKLSYQEFVEAMDKFAIKFSNGR